MTSPSTASLANAALVQGQPLTAVFSGGTSGIGELTVHALARNHGTSGKALRVYILGRNTEAANNIIHDCKQACPDGDFIFIKAEDLSLLKDVDRCCDEVMRLEREKAEGVVAKIDLLYISHADLHFGSRRESTEGLDKSMSFMYYSRMRMIQNLLPLLLASPLPAHIISIYAAGLEKKLQGWSPDDLDLRKPENYSLPAYRTHSTIMTTFYFEALAKQHPGRLSLVNVFPSLVITPSFDRNLVGAPWLLRTAFPILRPLLKLFIAVPTEEIGERMLFLASDRFPARGVSSGDGAAMGTDDSMRGGGAYSVKYTGETNDLQETYAPLRRVGMAEKVMQHTMKVFDTIGGGGKFGVE